jgi:hypothetical protein
MRECFELAFTIIIPTIIKGRLDQVFEGCAIQEQRFDSQNVAVAGAKPDQGQSACGIQVLR